jgi:hypothetical protein
MPSFSCLPGVKVFSSLALVSRLYWRSRAGAKKDQMPKKLILGLAYASVSLTLTTHAASFADSVVAYSPGTGIPAGYDNPNAALGEPSRVTPGQFGGPVDPFNPPYLKDQLVSIGAGGSLTLSFSSPIQNSAANAYGLDFIIFGNSGFQIVNGDFSGGGVTDGSLFGANSGPTRVSVSSDGVNYYQLTPSLAPVVDGPFPTDGSGDFSKPVNPAVAIGAFAGKDIKGIRDLYAGSAGGSAYDIGWARNSDGQPVALDSVRFVRIDVLAGVSEVDGISAVPEPATAALAICGAATLLFVRRRR